MITLIAAIGLSGEIGKDNQLLWKNSDDMRHFQTYTMGKHVIMGRKTYDSIGRALPGRTNLVLTSGTAPHGTLAADSMASLLSMLPTDSESVVIGGGKVYAQFMSMADKLVISHIDSNFDADAHFPTIDHNFWVVNNTVAHDGFTIKEYVRNAMGRNYDGGGRGIQLDQQHYLQSTQPYSHTHIG